MRREIDHVLPKVRSHPRGEHEARGGLVRRVAGEGAIARSERPLGETMSFWSLLNSRVGRDHRDHGGLWIASDVELASETCTCRARPARWAAGCGGHASRRGVAVAGGIQVRCAKGPVPGSVGLSNPRMTPRRPLWLRGKAPRSRRAVSGQGVAWDAGSVDNGPPAHSGPGAHSGI